MDMFTFDEKGKKQFCILSCVWIVLLCIWF